MRIAEILRGKGTAVTTIRPEASVRDLIATLAEHNIGAAVVVAAGMEIQGIVSERDVVRRLDGHGADLLDTPVSSIMTAEVRTCTPDDDVEGLRLVMTELRIRHLPVIRDGRLVGLVSIGDVVKSTISVLETEREHLVGYIQQA